MAGSNTSRSPSRLRSNLYAAGVLPGLAVTNTVGPAIPLAMGLGRRLLVSASERMMPTIARAAIRITQAQRRMGFAFCCRVSSLTSGAMRRDSTGREPDEDGEVIRGDGGEGDEGYEQDHVDRRRTRQWAGAGAPIREPVQVVGDAGRDRREAVEAGEVPEDEGGKHSLGDQQGPGAAVDLGRRSNRLHD